MKADLKKALLVAEEKNPGPQVKATVQCSSVLSMGKIAQFISKEWNITKTKHIGDNTFVFETNSYRATIVLSELRHKFPRAYVQGWTQSDKIKPKMQYFQMTAAVAADTEEEGFATLKAWLDGMAVTIPRGIGLGICPPDKGSTRK
jgi:hypothetical protein